MRLAAAELVESRQVLPAQWIQSFHAPELATGSRAGQFVHVRTGDCTGLVLRRPFSLNTADPASGIVTIHFRTIGRGTAWCTSSPAISPNSSKRSAMFTMWETTRSGLSTSGPATISGTQTPV